MEKYPLISSAAAVGFDWRSVEAMPGQGGHTRSDPFSRDALDSSCPYDLLLQERQLLSVVNLARQDGLDFLKIAPQAETRIETTALPLVRPTTS